MCNILGIMISYSRLDKLGIEYTIMYRKEVEYMTMKAIEVDCTFTLKYRLHAIINQR